MWYLNSIVIYHTFVLSKEVFFIQSIDALPPHTYTHTMNPRIFVTKIFWTLPGWYITPSFNIISLGRHELFTVNCSILSTNFVLKFAYLLLGTIICPKITIDKFRKMYVRRYILYNNIYIIKKIALSKTYHFWSTFNIRNMFFAASDIFWLPITSVTIGSTSYSPSSMSRWICRHSQHM